MSSELISRHYLFLAGADLGGGQDPPLFHTKCLTFGQATISKKISGSTPAKHVVDVHPWAFTCTRVSPDLSLPFGYVKHPGISRHFAPSLRGVARI